jgi:exonuclease-1
MVRLEGNAIVPLDYIPQFRLAELVFLHQRVYDPRQRKLVTLLPLEDGPLGALECAHIGA